MFEPSPVDGDGGNGIVARNDAAMTDFGVIKQVHLRSVWPHEATSFTPWLSQHLDSLSGTLGMDIELTQSEVSVGAFSCDILARETGTNRNVVIENQLEATDHSHLGQLLTYAAGHKAGVIVWIAREIREEHEAALTWLNQHTDGDTDFFGIVVSVIQIDDSRPAFTFELVVRPNDWQKRTLEDTNKVISPRWDRYRQFFQRLIDKLRAVHFTNATKGQPQGWYNFSAGVGGLSYALSFAANGRVRVELYIDYGHADLNKAILDAFPADKDSIERALGYPVEWSALTAKKPQESQPIATDQSIRPPTNWTKSMSGESKNFCDSKKYLDLDYATAWKGLNHKVRQVFSQT